jgi:hypothetical protein
VPYLPSENLGRSRLASRLRASVAAHEPAAADDPECAQKCERAAGEDTILHRHPADDAAEDKP